MEADATLAGGEGATNLNQGVEKAGKGEEVESERDQATETDIGETL
jgi:hypothetical protein